MSQAGRLSVAADRGRCCGSGNCASTLPEVFDQDDDGFVVVLKPSPADGLADALRDVAETCPVQAITVSV